MSQPIPERTMWTVDDLENLPDDGNRYEILHGELLVTPPPAAPHQGAATRLARILGVWCHANSGWLVHAPSGVYMSKTTWLEPDVAVYPVPEFSRQSWQEFPPPLLVVEVLSKSTRKRDRHRKRPAYLAHGIQQVWIIDEEARTIERWTSASEFPEQCGASITWNPDSAFPPLEITEAELFGPRP